jgi:hypothetical protein
MQKKDEKYIKYLILKTRLEENKDGRHRQKYNIKMNLKEMVG